MKYFFELSISFHPSDDPRKVSTSLGVAGHALTTPNEKYTLVITQFEV